MGEAYIIFQACLKFILPFNKFKNSNQISIMAYKGGKVQKVMVQPINLIFRYLQNRSRVSVWLYENVNTRIEGCIIGFDEYMNLVMDNAEEIHMLKGDNITLLQQIDGGMEGAA